MRINMRDVNGYKVAASLALMLALLLVAGCGGGAETQNKDFFTSGDREADQRAGQRMAQAEQLKGEGEGAGDKPKTDDDKKSLFARLGGQAGIEGITDDFVTRAMADPRVNWDRNDVKQGGFSIHTSRSVQWDPTPDHVKALKSHLAEFLALATGGPSEYHGKEMAAAHKNLHITNAEFDASVGDLKATLDKMQIPNKEQKELLAIVETTRAQVVQDR